MQSESASPVPVRDRELRQLLRFLIENRSETPRTSEAM